MSTQYKTQYKFYKTTCTAGGIDTTSVTKNPFKLDEVENGGIVLAVDNTSSPPNFGRMYFKNPFGTAYGKDGKLFEVGTNVSTLNVNGNATVGGEIDVGGSTFVGPNRIQIVDQNANESVVISKGNIQFASQSADANGTISVDQNLSLLVNNNKSVNINNVALVPYINNNKYSLTIGKKLSNSDVVGDLDNINLNAETTSLGGGLYVETGIQANEVTIGYSSSRLGILNTYGSVVVDGNFVADTGPYSPILQVSLEGARQFSIAQDGTYVKGPLTAGSQVSIGDGVAPSVSNVSSSEVPMPGVHVWHSVSDAIKGVSITGGGTDTYPQIRIYDNQNNCKIDMNGYHGDITAKGTISGGTVKGTQLKIGITYYTASFNNGVLTFSAV